jgi:hypothetical protein
MNRKLTKNRIWVIITNGKTISQCGKSLIDPARLANAASLVIQEHEGFHHQAQKLVPRKCLYMRDQGLSRALHTAIEVEKSPVLQQREVMHQKQRALEYRMGEIL